MNCSQTGVGQVMAKKKKDDVGSETLPTSTKEKESPRA